VADQGRKKSSQRGKQVEVLFNHFSMVSAREPPEKVNKQTTCLKPEKQLKNKQVLFIIPP
jgi:hypothetical protein